jgi:hypothetical protein
MQVWFIKNDEIKSGSPAASNERYHVFVPGGLGWPETVEVSSCYSSYGEAAAALMKVLSKRQSDTNNKLGQLYVDLAQVAKKQTQPNPPAA